jgi:uncharacterized membrane protein HdeD (DUF308 family)
MKNKLEGIIEIVAALIVLFSSMWDPQLSAVLAVAALVIFGVIKLLSDQKDKKSQSEISNEK